MSSQAKQSERERVNPSGSPQAADHRRLIELLAAIIARASKEQAKTA